MRRRFPEPFDVLASCPGWMQEIERASAARMSAFHVGGIREIHHAMWRASQVFACQRITSTTNGHSKGVLPRLLEFEWHRLEVLRSGRHAVDPDLAPIKRGLTVPQRQTQFAPTHGDVGSTKAQALQTSKSETPVCGLARLSPNNACMGRNQGNQELQFLCAIRCQVLIFLRSGAAPHLSTAACWSPRQSGPAIPRQGKAQPRKCVRWRIAVRASPKSAMPQSPISGMSCGSR